MKTIDIPENPKNIPYYSGFDEIPEEEKNKLWEQGLPFYYKSEKKSKAIVICFHGYTASPYETRPIAEACLKLGIDSVAPLMPGHGFADKKVQKKELSTKMRKDDMFEVARIEIRRARKMYEKVFIYGQSMGGVIATAIAGEGLVEACAMTSPALKLPFGSGIGSWLFAWTNFTPKAKLTEAEKHFFNLSYKLLNSRSGLQLLKMIYYARKKMYDITCPVLEVHSHNDTTIDPIVAKWFQDRCKGPVEIAWFDESDHTMPLDVKGKEVSECIANFFAKWI
jgi:carboxylesterase